MLIERFKDDKKSVLQTVSYRETNVLERNFPVGLKNQSSIFPSTKVVKNGIYKIIMHDPF